MKLAKVHVREFKSIRDSTEFSVADITCLVGKNEAGKTALLQSLYRLSPIENGNSIFDVTNDYPRFDVENYRHAVEKGTRKPAVVVKATFKLETGDADNPRELDDIARELGPDALKTTEVTLERGYSNVTTFSLAANDVAALKFLISHAQLPPDLSSTLGAASGIDGLLAALTAAEASEEVSRLVTACTAIKKRGVNGYIYDEFLKPVLPKFLYFDEYYQMKGCENLDALLARRQAGTQLPSDYPLLGLIELARLSVDDLLNPDTTQDLKNRLEGAGNHLTRQTLGYWSQNKHLEMRFDVRPARPKDPEGMREGINIWAEVYDRVHYATTGLGTRSRGFVWFFSFLAWYASLRESNLTLLLDEPGLSLHAKAQADLLRYFEKGRAPEHQLLYTTHSPFMVDPARFDRVRIVQDRSIDAEKELPAPEAGTKVLSDILEASEDTLFPLQGALGYEIHQTLFIGPNCLIVEGVSDLLYIQTISGLLSSMGREALKPEWTVTPVGGSDKVPTFVALIGAQRSINLATLIDFQKKDQQTIENLYKKKLLAKNRVLTFADFVGTPEADIEDMFDAAFYLKLLNGEYGKQLAKKVKESDLDKNLPRILTRLERHFEAVPMKSGGLNHYRPARYFAENVASLGKQVPATTLDRFEAAFKALNAVLPV